MVDHAHQIIGDGQIENLCAVLLELFENTSSGDVVVIVMGLDTQNPFCGDKYQGWEGCFRRSLDFYNLASACALIRRIHNFHIYQSFRPARDRHLA